MAQTIEQPGTVHGVSKRLEGVIFDIDGVLTVSGHALPGATEALRCIQRAGISCAFLTNMTRPRSAVLARLAALGVEVEPGSVLSAPAATLHYLQKHHPGESCLLLASDALREDFDGVPLTQDPSEAAVVVVGGPHEDSANDHLSYWRMNDAFRAVLGGATLVAMQRGLSWETDDGPALDAGGIVAALEAAAGTKAIVCGKPSRLFFEAAVARLGLAPGSILMVGDDVVNDIRGASAAGLVPVLVRTGKFRPGHVDSVRGTPFHLVDSVADVPRILGI